MQIGKSFPNDIFPKFSVVLNALSTCYLLDLKCSSKALVQQFVLRHDVLAGVRNFKR